MIKNTITGAMLLLLPILSLAQINGGLMESLKKEGLMSGTSLKIDNPTQNDNVNSGKFSTANCSYNQVGANNFMTGMSTGSLIPALPPNTFISANDFDVNANTNFSIEKITFEMSMMTMEASTQGMTFDIYFYNNNNGLVGSTIKTFNNILPESITLNNRGTYNVIINLPESLAINNNTNLSKKFWLGLGNKTVTYVYPPSGNVMGIPSYWVSAMYSQNTESYPAMVNENGVWTVWTNDMGYNAEGNFMLNGSCDDILGVENLDKKGLSYYPNPVKDVLNIDSKENILSISAYNLAGQQVLTNSNVQKGQINVASLVPGTYIFKLDFENGKTESIKVIKK